VENNLEMGKGKEKFGAFAILIFNEFFKFKFLLA